MFPRNFISLSAVCLYCFWDNADFLFAWLSFRFFLLCKKGNYIENTAGLWMSPLENRSKHGIKLIKCSVLYHLVCNCCFRNRYCLMGWIARWIAIHLRPLHEKGHNLMLYGSLWNPKMILFCCWGLGRYPRRGENKFIKINRDLRSLHGPLLRRFLAIPVFTVPIFIFGEVHGVSGTNKAQRKFL